MTITRKTLADIECEPPISQERLAEIAAIPDEDIDTSDIPELDERFWENAQVCYRCLTQ